jgi:hypothetical protein
VNAARLFPSRQQPARTGPSLWYALPIGLAIGFAVLAIGVAILTGVSWVLRELIALGFPKTATVSLGTVSGIIITLIALAVAVFAPTKRGLTGKGLTRGQRITMVAFVLFGLVMAVDQLVNPR